MTFINISPDEIEKFDKLAKSWWEKDGDLRTLHDINPPRMEFIQNHIPLAGKRVLDVGCGGGILSESLAQCDAEVSALDMSAELINVAKHHSKLNNLPIEYFTMNVEEYAKQSPATFDIVTCMELLEHVPDPSSIISSCAKLLKPNGYLFLSTINRNMKAYLFTILGAEYLLNLIPKHTHDYAKFIRPSEISTVLRQEGFNVEKISGLEYNPLNRKAYLSDDISVNYLLCAQLNK